MKNEDHYILMNGQRVARLEFQTIDDPFVLFRLADYRKDVPIIIASPRGSLEHQLMLEDSSTGETIEGTDLILTQYAEDRVSVRDLRAPTCRSSVIGRLMDCFRHLRSEHDRVRRPD